MLWVLREWDHKVVDGKVEMIPYLKADGTPKLMKDIYPIAGMVHLANWSGFRAPSNPAFSDSLKKVKSDALDEMRSKGFKKYPLPKIELITDYPSKDKDLANGNYPRDLNNLMQAKDVEEEWKKMCEQYLRDGYTDIINEVNQIAQKKGLK